MHKAWVRRLGLVLCGSVSASTAITTAAEIAVAEVGVGVLPAQAASSPFTRV